MNESNKKNKWTSKVLLVFALILSMAWGISGIAAAAEFPDRSPKYLSDLYKFFTHYYQQELSPDIRAKHVIIGRSWNIYRTGEIRKLESELKEFNWQDLRFLKAHFEFIRLKLNKDALLNWKIKIEDVKEVKCSMVFSLKSMEKKLRKIMNDPSLELRADIAKQEFILKGQGKLAGVSSAFVTRAKPRWDADKAELRLDPLEVTWAGMKTPDWLWWAGSGAWPVEAVLKLKSAWIPYNIQEVNLGWDRVSLSTDW